MVSLGRNKFLFSLIMNFKLSKCLDNVPERESGCGARQGGGGAAVRGAAALRGEGQGGQRQAEEGVQERGAHIPLQIVLVQRIISQKVVDGILTVCDQKC